MTKTVDEPKSCSNKTILSYSSRLTKIQNKAQPKNNSGADWVWDDEGILASRFHLSEDAKCKCGNEYQSMDHILFHWEEINAQRELLKQQRGTWPASKEDLITKYKKEFS
jgi:hypothetical protein